MMSNAKNRLAFAVWVFSFTPAAHAQSVEEFYRGRTINLVVGSGVGGSFDIGARLMAQHLRRFIPGNPIIVVQNMAGASSVRATEYLYNVAPRDGTVIADIQPTIVLNRLLGRSAKYKPEDFGWIGRLRERTNFGLVWHESPAKTIEEATLLMAASRSLGTCGGAMSPSPISAVASTHLPGTLGRASFLRKRIMAVYPDARCGSFFNELTAL